MLTPRQKAALTALKVHWPALEPDAFGYAKPACSHVGSFKTKPIITSDFEDVTCKLCQAIMPRGPTG